MVTHRTHYIAQHTAWSGSMPWFNSSNVDAVFETLQDAQALNERLKTQFKNYPDVKFRIIKKEIITTVVHGN